MLKLKETPEQIELVKAMGSKNKLVAMEAQEAFAAFIGSPIQEVLMQLGTAAMIYSDETYDEDDDPSFPLDLYYGTDVDHVQCWSQNMAGGLATSHVAGQSELKISTYRLDSAVSMLKKYARRARLNVVAAAISRMSNEVLIKQEYNAWAVIMRALGEATTNGADHLLTSTTQDILQVDDFNRMITLNKRINQSYADGTPVNAYSNGITDLFVSPEMMEQVRAFAYQPMNTRGVPNSDESTVLGLPDAIREGIFRSAGVQAIYDVTLHSLNELGVNQKYDHVFNLYVPASVAHGSQNFDPTDDEILVGVDLSRDACKRLLARNADSGATFTVEVDDQFERRAEKLGWYGSLEEGRVVIDSRVLQGLIV